VAASIVLPQLLAASGDPFVEAADEAYLYK